MKTIGERFDEMAEAAGVSKTDKSYYFGRSCCFQIATEQKAIDEKEMFAEREKAFNNGYEVAKKELIDKACETYEKELRQMKRILNEVSDGAGKLISVGGSLVQFRKRMEKE